MEEYVITNSTQLKVRDKTSTNKVQLIKGYAYQ